MAVSSEALQENRALVWSKTQLFRISKGLNGIGMAVLVFMMALMVIDVILRYIFNSPLQGTLENVEFMMAILVSWGFAYTAMKKGHVTVDFITLKFSHKVQTFIEVINAVMCLAISILMTWQTVAFANLQRTGHITTSVLQTPVYPIIYAVAFGFAILCLVYLYELFVNISKFSKISKWGSWLTLIVTAAVLLFVCSIIVIKGSSLLQINSVTAGVIGIVLLVLLIFSNMTLGMVMAILGFLGMSFVAGFQPGLTSLGVSPYSTVSAYSFSVIPLFVLMGSFCFFSGLSRDLYFSVYKWIGHFPGGLAMATIGACAGFAAICGSSVATVATLGTVAYPEMKKYRYNSKLATGCIAAGGGLGVLIPPSIILAIYGILTEQSIGKLFLAGFIPGIIEAIFLIATIYIICKRNPDMGPRGEISTWKERFSSLTSIWGVLALFLLVIGGLYAGIFTPTEAAAVGAAGALIFVVIRKQLNWKNFKGALLDTGSTTSMCLLILVGATVLGYFLAVTRLPYELSNLIVSLNVSRYAVFGIIFLIYFLLGMVLSSVAMVVLTVPIFFPIMMALGFDPIWFGIIVVKVTEIAMITPPVGMNVFVMAGIAKDVPMYDIFRGIVPFLIAELANVGLLLLVPQITTILPNMMK